MMADPKWTALLTDEDEWVVRTALANIASDLERVADAAAQIDGTSGARIRESAQRYRLTLARIEMADVTWRARHPTTAENIARWLLAEELS